MRAGLTPVSRAVLGLAAAVAVVAHAFAKVGPYDDAYITFRFVENLLEGRGLVYNPGEHVLGVTAPLHAGWLTLLKLALPGVELPTLAVRGNVVFLLLAALMAFRLLRRLGLGTAACVSSAALMLVSEGILRASIGGMESSLYVALTLTALERTAAGCQAMATTLASLAVLARPEGVFVLLVVMWAWFRERPIMKPVRTLLPGALILAAWALGASLYYGSPVPQSVLAKANLYLLPPGTALRSMADSAGRWILGGALKPLQWVVALSLTLWALYGWWRGVAPRREARYLALPFVLLLHVLFYSISNPMLSPWYMPAIQATWLIVVLSATLGPGVARPTGRVLQRLAAACIVVAGLAATLSNAMTGSDSIWKNGAVSDHRNRILAAYEQTAAWVGSHSNPSDTVAAAEIGLLGYLLDRRILDACGLVSKEALAFLPAPVEERFSYRTVAISSDFVRATRPDWVVTLQVFAIKSLLDSPWFQREYVLVHSEPVGGEIWQSTDVLTFQRRSRPLAAVTRR